MLGEREMMTIYISSASNPQFAAEIMEIKQDKYLNTLLTVHDMCKKSNANRYQYLFVRL